jgi:hypothetical protein
MEKSLVEGIFDEKDHLFDVNGELFDDSFLIGVGFDLFVESHDFEEVDKDLVRVSDDFIFCGISQLDLQVLVIGRDQTFTAVKNGEGVLTDWSLGACINKFFEVSDLADQIFLGFDWSVQHVEIPEE